MRAPAPRGFSLYAMGQRSNAPCPVRGTSGARARAGRHRAVARRRGAHVAPQLLRGPSRAAELLPSLVVIDGDDAEAAQLLTRSIRFHEATRGTAIAVMNRSLSHEFEMRLLAAGATVILPVPVDPLLWDGRLEELLHVPQRRRGAHPRAAGRLVALHRGPAGGGRDRPQHQLARHPAGGTAAPAPGRQAGHHVPAPRGPHPPACGGRGGPSGGGGRGAAALRHRVPGAARRVPQPHRGLRRLRPARTAAALGRDRRSGRGQRVGARAEGQRGPQGRDPGLGAGLRDHRGPRGARPRVQRRCRAHLRPCACRGVRPPRHRAAGAAPSCATRRGGASDTSWTPASGPCSGPVWRPGPAARTARSSRWSWP